MMQLVASTSEIMNSLMLLFVAIAASVGVKTYLLALLLPQKMRRNKSFRPWFFIVGVIVASFFSDFAWMIKIVYQSISPEISYAIVVFFIRLSWALFVLQYQCLALFMESLIEKKFRLSAYNILCIIVSGALSGYFLFEAFFDSRLTACIDRTEAFSRAFATAPVEILITRCTSFYILLALALPSLIFTCKRLQAPHLPTILRKQIRIFLFLFLIPYIVIETIIAASMSITFFNMYYYPAVITSTFLLAIAIFFCVKKVMSLRFLNGSEQVTADHSFDFIQDFSDTLTQLSHVTSFKELRSVTQSFCSEALDIPRTKIWLCIRTEQPHIPSADDNYPLGTYIENALTNNNYAFINALRTHKIFIRDEIAFTNFYETHDTYKTVLEFIEAINADIFLPLYDKGHIVAYIIVERDTRPHLMYSKAEQDELLVFSNYVANIINLMQHRSLENLLHEEKELSAELYSKQREINQYKESIRSFLHTTKSSCPGIMFYKNRHFIFANQIAKDMIGINLNTLAGHPTAQTLKRLVHSVEEYQQSRTCFITDKHNNRLVVSATPNLEATHIILTISYPDITDIIAKHSDQIKDPTQWDYLLYLETTQSGQLINQLIPGSGATLLAFKIELLKLALSNKALLLEAPEEDALSLVQIIHHISLHSTLVTLELTQPCRTTKETLQLFGINELYRTEHGDEPLLEKLADSGTIFIKNIHFLNLETQKMLAEYVTSGLFREYKGTKKQASSARIICSTNVNLESLVQEGAFCAELYKELRKTALCMPSLSSLSNHELSKLADGYSEQALQSLNFKNLLTLTDKEKNKLADSPPLSLQELKTRVQNILIQKSKKNNIYHETQFDPAYTVDNPELIAAARLGKQALRDPKIMALLWSTFKSQSKIATFLGVNRSSVNRRCKKNPKECIYAP